MKFEFNWPSGFRGDVKKNVDGRRTDRHRSDWYTILRLKWAKKLSHTRLHA